MEPVNYHIKTGGIFMTTKIIPQIKDIVVYQMEVSFKEFYLEEKIKVMLPIAPEIFEYNKKGENLYPITIAFGEMESESYRISINEENIAITTAIGDKRGLMYALFTLSELAIMNDDVLTGCEIFDEPTLKFRALSDDISRGQISTTADFFSIIRKLARYKYNTYMPYMEDVFKFAFLDAWGKYSEPMDKYEWLSIIEYAGEYQIDVRPILNLLGHFDKSAYIQELQPLAIVLEGGEIANCLDPKNPKVREIIVQMLDEIVETFGEGLIHVGGDEPVDLTKAYGKDEGGTLFIEHYTFIASELKKRGCTCMVYADFFAPPWGDYAAPVDRAKELPDDVQFVFWDYAVRSEYPYVQKLHEQNLQMYISPGSWTWNRFACDFKMAYNNVKGLLKADNGKSLGMIMSSWADGGDTLRELTWGGVVTGANYCWSPDSDYSYEDIYELYHISHFGIPMSDALKLDSVYHYDYLVTRNDEHEFKNVMFADPYMPIVYEDKQNVPMIQAVMKQVKLDMSEMNVERNIDAFNALNLAVARITYTANKIMGLPDHKVKTIEEGIPYSNVAHNLACELMQVKELHRKLWYKNNRNSEWACCEARYDDEYDRLKMFARNICLKRKVNI